MDVCSDGHGEVAHEDRDCPACGLLQTIDELKAEVADQEGKLENMYGENERLREELGEE